MDNKTDFVFVSVVKQDRLGNEALPDVATRFNVALDNDRGTYIDYDGGDEVVSIQYAPLIDADGALILTAMVHYRTNAK